MLSGFGTWFQIVTQSLLILDLSHSGAALGIAAALQYLPVLLLSPYAGVITDRWLARRILLTTNALAAGLAAMLGTVTALGHVTTGWVWAMAPGLGIVLAFDRPAQSAIIAELMPLGARPNASALANVQTASGRSVGPAVAGVLYAAVGPASCFLLNAASYLVILVALARIRPEELIGRPRRLALGALGELRAGLSYVRNAPAVRAPLVCAAAMGLTTFNFLTVIPAMITFTFHAGGRAFGICEALTPAPRCWADYGSPRDWGDRRGASWPWAAHCSPSPCWATR